MHILSVAQHRVINPSAAIIILAYIGPIYFGDIWSPTVRHVIKDHDKHKNYPYLTHIGPYYGYFFLS